MRKLPKKHHRKLNIDKLLPLFFIAGIAAVFFAFTYKDAIMQKSKEAFNKEEMLHLLFTGDIFLDRGIDVKSQSSPLSYKYPFSGLSTLNRQDYDAWIGNLECPVTDEQSSMYEKENYLKFSCKKEYLPELKKYFDYVSLANNHTDNMNGRKGIEETRQHLKEAGIQYFGDYDNSEKDSVCSIVFVQTKDDKIPIALCGFHGVFKLPTDDEMKVIDEYSKYFVTIVMPHQGVEYEPRSNSFQKKIYHAFIDHGADAVIGSHPHVIEEVEEYKGKIIFYSLGNFIFDQTWVKTREHMTLDTSIAFPQDKNSYKDLDCTKLSSLMCLARAQQLNIRKPEFNIQFKPIFTHADMDFVTKKEEQTEVEYQKSLKSIGFDKVASSSKIQ